MGEPTPIDASVFTTLRWQKGCVAWFPMHLRRLQEHAQRLDIEWPEDFLERLHSTPIQGEGNLCRIELARDGNIAIELRNSQYPPSPLKAVSQPAPRFSEHAQGTKHASWGGYQDARRHSIDKGADIGLLVHDGVVVDGDRCTPILLDQDGVAFAPTPEGGGVDSVTIRVLKPAIEAAGIPFRNARLTENLLGRAAEVIVVGTGVGVAWLSEIDGQAVGTGVAGPLFNTCESAFHLELVEAWAPLGAIQ